MDFTAVSLFTGAGGMDIGMLKAGFKILWANDINEDACKTYAQNHDSQIECGDVSNYIPELTRFKGIDLLFGGPPCQGFSVAGKMDPNDERSQLVFKFMDAVDNTMPKAFILENVKALGSLSKWSLVREALFQRAERAGYKSSYLIILNASDFGVPQKRERMFFIGLRDVDHIWDFDSLFDKYRCKGSTVGDIVKELGKAGSELNNRVCKAKITIAKKPILRKSPYAGMLFNGAGRPIDPSGYSCTLAASIGGNRTPIIDEGQIFDSKSSWIESYHAHLMNGGEPLVNEKVPNHLRRMTVDEALRIQTFPNDYKFIGRQNSIYSQIGNAVPPELAYVVGKVVSNLITPTKNLPTKSFKGLSKEKVTDYATC